MASLAYHPPVTLATHEEEIVVRACDASPACRR